MSDIKNKTESDDEFQDAIGEAASNITAKPSDKQTEQKIEELIEQQEKLGLSEENEKEHSADADEQGAAADVDDNDDIDEEQLKQKEATMTETELQHNKEEADKKKLDGNKLFGDGNAEQSITLYSEALMICPTKYTKERAILYGNRAAAKIQLGSDKSAIQDCSKALELSPDYVRALLRRAKLHERTNELDAALADFKRVYELDPGQSDARLAMVRLPPLIEKRNEEMKTEMFSKLKDLGNMVLKPFGLSTSNFQMQQDPSTGSYSFNFNQNQS